MPFPGGIKGYLQNPAAILDARPACPACGAAAMHVHEHCRRNSDLAGEAVKTTVFRLRCSACRTTRRVLPDEMLAGLTFALPTIAGTCADVLDDQHTYRGAALAACRHPLPAGEKPSTVWGGPDAPSPTPSTVFRWVKRLVEAAPAWWIAVLPEVQARLEEAIQPPEPPAPPAVRAHSEAKATALRDGWHVLWLARGLASRLRLGSWAKVLATAPVRPAGLDRTGFFVRGIPRPP